MRDERGAVTVTACLRGIRSRLREAGAIAAAAVACAEAGSEARGLEIALDLEELVREANLLLNAASLLQRGGLDHAEAAPR